MEWARRLFQCIHHLNKIVKTSRRATGDFVRNLGERVLTHTPLTRHLDEPKPDNAAMGGTSQENTDSTLTDTRLAGTYYRFTGRLITLGRRQIFPFKTRS